MTGRPGIIKNVEKHICDHFKVLFQYFKGMAEENLENCNQAPE
jgi:hypothetical protein